MPRGSYKPKEKKTRAQKIGDRGELRIVECLKTFLPEIQVIHDVMLEINGDTSQIDVIAVTNAGIFVIEVKNYCADKIFCNPDWKYWYYLLPDVHKTVQKCTFYNPIWQNATHVELISEMFHHTVPVYNIVMFSKNNPLAFIDSQRPECVVGIFNLRSYIESKKGNIPEETIKAIVSTINANNRTDIPLSQHIDNISRYKD